MRCAQKDGTQTFSAYVRGLIAERAREEYSALVESTGMGVQESLLTSGTITLEHTSCRKLKAGHTASSMPAATFTIRVQYSDHTIRCVMWPKGACRHKHLQHTHISSFNQHL